MGYKMEVVLNRCLMFIILLAAAAPLAAVDLTIVGPPGAVLKLWDGGEAVLDPTGKYIFRDLEPGVEIGFTTEAAGRYPDTYAIEMGELSKTFRVFPPPTGVIAGELKFTDAGFCPAAGVELYFVPENAYVSVDLYQSFFSLTQMFSGSYDVSSRYIMPMLGAGLYLFPFDSLVRLNFGLSLGAGFGNELPNALFTAEMSAGIEFKFFDHYIIFAEFNPRLHSPLTTGWDDYSDIYGATRSGNMYTLGNWALYGFPSTMFGLKYKY